MTARVILFQSITLDGASADRPDEEALAAELVASLGGAVVLRGAGEALLRFRGGPPWPETEADRQPPPAPPSHGQPHLVIADSAGRLRGLLHAFRGTGRTRDPVMLLSAATTDAYRAWLSQRGYRHATLPGATIGLRPALAWLAGFLATPLVLVETRPALASALLDAGLVDELSFLLHPRLGVGSGGPIAGGAGAHDLRLAACEPRDGALWLRYAVEPGAVAAGPEIAWPGGG